MINSINKFHFFPIFKNMKNAQKGFTLLELLIVIGILAILVVAVLVTLNPAETQKKARDIQRLRDGSTLQSMLDQYINSGGAPSTCITSSTGCTSSGLTGVCGTGNWLGLNLCAYGNSVPVDPINTGTRRFVSAAGTAALNAEYKAKVSGSDYEVDVRQESTANSSKVANDGGNDSMSVEYGTSLTLL